MFKPFLFSYINRGYPLNDFLWHLTTPPEEGFGVGTTIACGSDPSLEGAQREAASVVKAIHTAMEKFKYDKSTKGYTYG